MDGRKIYEEQIKPLIDNFKTTDNRRSKVLINETMANVIPIVKEVYNYVNTNQMDNNPYLIGIHEAYINNPGINVRSVNVQKVNSFLYDLEDYVNFHVMAQR